MENEFVIEMRNIVKSYPGVVAVNDVNLSLKKGEILGLVGENGAGKSTLIKILSGAQTADKGEIIINGAKLNRYSAKQAIDMGISVIYQELNYLNDMTIADNIFLGRVPVKGKLFLKQVDKKKLYKNAEKYIREVGLNYPPSTLVRKLTVAEKQLVEIAKCIARESKTLVFDEPTAALNDNETANLFKMIKEIAQKGISIIYISHRLNEIFTLSDRVQIMRDGKSIALLNTKDTCKEEVVRYMVGRNIEEMYPMGPSNPQKTVLEVINVSTEYIKEISFYIRQGEIVGLYGLLGSGTEDVVRAVFGAEVRKSGQIKVNNRIANINSPFEAINSGIAYIPSERKSEALMLIHNIKSNIFIANLKKITKRFVLQLKKEKIITEEWIGKLSIKVANLNAEVGSLSGGNQQKVVLARILNLEPKIILMNNPTRGIDVGSKVEVYKLMEKIKNQNIGLLLISSELPEILSLCDRVYTIYEGKITGEFEKSDINEKNIIQYAIGR